MIYFLNGHIVFLCTVGVGLLDQLWAWSMSLGLDMTLCPKSILSEAATFGLQHNFEKEEKEEKKSSPRTYA